MNFLLPDDVLVSHYRWLLKIWDFIQYWDLQMLHVNNIKSNFSFNETNTKDLPVMYSTVFCVCSLFHCFFFLLYCITTVTPVIRRSASSSTKVTRHLWYVNCLTPFLWNVYLGCLCSTQTPWSADPPPPSDTKSHKPFGCAHNKF